MAHDRILANYLNNFSPLQSQKPAYKPLPEEDKYDFVDENLQRGDTRHVREDLNLWSITTSTENNSAKKQTYYYTNENSRSLFSPLDKYDESDPALFYQNFTSSPAIGNFASRLPLSKSFKDVFQNSVFDMGQHHHQMVEAYEYANNNGLSRKPMDFVHFDSHSDTVRTPEIKNVNIGNFITQLIKEGKIADNIYWVMPENLYENRFINSKVTNCGAIDYNLSLLPSKEFIYRNKQTGKLIFSACEKSENGEQIVKDPPEFLANPSNYQKITFHKITANQLPDFNGKDIALSLDADYFSSSGKNAIAKNPADELDSKYFNDFVDTLNNKNIRPSFTFAALSDNYVLREDRLKLKQFFHDIAQNSKTGDTLATYSLDIEEGTSGISHRITTKEDKFLDFLWRVEQNDLNTKTPDNYLATDLKNNPEYDKALLDLREIYAFSEEEAKNVLTKLDHADGAYDGKIAYLSLYAIIQLTGELNPRKFYGLLQEK